MFRAGTLTGAASAAVFQSGTCAAKIAKIFPEFGHFIVWQALCNAIDVTQLVMPGQLAAAHETHTRSQSAARQATAEGTNDFTLGFEALISDVTTDETQKQTKPGDEPTIESGSDADINSRNGSETDDDQFPGPLPFQAVVLEKPYRTWLLFEAGTTQQATEKSSNVSATTISESAKPIETLHPVALHTAFELKFHVDRKSTDDSDLVARESRASEPPAQVVQKPVLSAPSATVEPRLEKNAQPALFVAASTPNLDTPKGDAPHPETLEQSSLCTSDKQPDRSQAISVLDAKNEHTFRADHDQEEIALPREPAQSQTGMSARSTVQLHDSAQTVHQVVGSTQVRGDGHEPTPRSIASDSPTRIDQAPIDQTTRAQSPVSSVKLTVQTESGHSIDLRISDRRGDVHIVARTSDPNVSAELKKGVPQLLNALQESGVTDPIETTSSPDRQEQDNQGNARHSGESEQKEYAQNERRDRRRQHRHRGSEVFAAQLNNIQAHN